MSSECNICLHKNQTNIGGHCKYFYTNPELVRCSNYINKDAENNENNKKLQKAINIKALQLFDNFYNVTKDMSVNDWIDFINDQTLSEAKTMNSPHFLRYINDFGNYGLTFSCKECNARIELDDDTQNKCPYCNGGIVLTLN